jgi:hypothetical protein
MFVGGDESRAALWLKHEDPKRASPWTVRDTVRLVAEEMGAPEEFATREYERIYRQVSMAKHGNPMVFGEVGVVTTEDCSFVVAGPYSSVQTRRWSHSALLFGIRYTKLTAVKFARDHLPPSAIRDRLFTELVALTERINVVTESDRDEFKDEPKVA